MRKSEKNVLNLLTITILKLKLTHGIKLQKFEKNKKILENLFSKLEHECLKHFYTLILTMKIFRQGNVIFLNTKEKKLTQTDLFTIIIV